MESSIPGTDTVVVCTGIAFDYWPTINRTRLSLAFSSRPITTIDFQTNLSVISADDSDCRFDAVEVSSSSHLRVLAVSSKPEFESGVYGSGSHFSGRHNVGPYIYLGSPALNGLFASPSPPIPTVPRSSCLSSRSLRRTPAHPTNTTLSNPRVRTVMIALRRALRR